MLVPSLPAAATNRMPASPLAWMAFCIDRLDPPPPQLLFVTRTFTSKLVRIMVA